MKLLLIVMILIIAVLSPGGESLNSNAVAYIEKFIQKNMKRHKIPGIALGLVENNKIVLAKGYGVRNIDTGKAVDENTLFHIGSVNKGITAMLVATLVDSGELGWSSPISAIRPNLSFSDKLVGTIKMEQLTTLTSGILADDEDYFFEDFGDNAKPNDLFRYISKMELEKEPGTKFSYSNMSMSLAGYLAVYADKGNTSSLNQGYSDSLEKRILLPIGMTSSTVFASVARAADNYSVSHEKKGKKVWVAESYDSDDDPLAPSGSLKSNALDMSRYLITQLNKGLSPDGIRVVSEANLTQTWAPTKISKRQRYAMGWAQLKIGKKYVLSHEGAYDNFVSVVTILPDENVGMVILCNTESVGRLLTQAPRVLVKALKKYNKAHFNNNFRN